MVTCVISFLKYFDFYLSSIAELQVLLTNQSMMGRQTDRHYLWKKICWMCPRSQTGKGWMHGRDCFILTIMKFTGMISIFFEPWIFVPNKSSIETSPKDYERHFPIALQYCMNVTSNFCITVGNAWCFWPKNRTIFQDIWCIK